MIQFARGRRVPSDFDGYFTATLQLDFPPDSKLRWVYRIVGFQADRAPIVLARRENGVTFDHAFPYSIAPDIEVGPMSRDDGTVQQTISYPYGRLDKVRATVLIYPPAKAGQASSKPVLREMITEKANP